jgi:hypothetical protein
MPCTKRIRPTRPTIKKRAGIKPDVYCMKGTIEKGPIKTMKNGMRYNNQKPPLGLGTITNANRPPIVDAIKNESTSFFKLMIFHT